MSKVTHCIECGVELDALNSIYKKGYRIYQCRECINRKAREKRASPDDYTQTAEFKLKRREWNLSRRGTTLEQYEQTRTLQLNGCAICKQLLNGIVHTDHDHKTGKFRGLLCHKCNIALGMLNEDENLIWNMLEYLKKHAERIAV